MGKETTLSLPSDPPKGGIGKFWGQGIALRSHVYVREEGPFSANYDYVMSSCANVYTRTATEIAITDWRLTDHEAAHENPSAH